MTLDIDVATPEELPQQLRKAAEMFNDSYETLKEAHQDKKAGKIWARAALILETAADKIDMEIKKHV